MPAAAASADPIPNVSAITLLTGTPIRGTATKS
jgi:hypothetical protein